MISQTAFIIYDIYDRKSDDVNIEVNIGHGQVGASLVKLNEVTLGEFENSFKEKIGVSKDLKGKIINIFTTIHDIQPNTNKVSLDLIISGGKKVHERSIIDSSVPSHGAIASSLITILFI